MVQREDIAMEESYNTKQVEIAWSQRNLIVSNNMDPILLDDKEVKEVMKYSVAHSKEYHPNLNILSLESLNYSDVKDDFNKRFFLNNSQLLVSEIDNKGIYPLDKQISWLKWDPSGNYLVTYDVKNILNFYKLESGNSLLNINQMKLTSKIEDSQFITLEREYKLFNSNGTKKYPHLGPLYQSGNFCFIFINKDADLTCVYLTNNNISSFNLSLTKYLPNNRELLRIQFLKDQYITLLIKSENKLVLFSFQLDMTQLIDHPTIEQFKMVEVVLPNDIEKERRIQNQENDSTNNKQEILDVFWDDNKIVAYYCISYKKDELKQHDNYSSICFIDVEESVLKGQINLDNLQISNNQFWNQDRIILIKYIKLFNCLLVFFSSGKIEVWDKITKQIISKWDNLNQLIEFSTSSKPIEDDDLVHSITFSPNQCLAIILTKNKVILIINLFSLLKKCWKKVDNEDNNLNNFIPYFITAFLNEKDMVDLISAAFCYPLPITSKDSKLNENDLTSFINNLDTANRTNYTANNDKQTTFYQFDKFLKLQVLICRTFINTFDRHFTNLLMICKLKFCIEILHSNYYESKEKDEEPHLTIDNLRHLTITSIYIYNYLLFLLGDLMNHHRNIKNNEKNNITLTRERYSFYGILHNPNVRKLFGQLLHLVNKSENNIQHISKSEQDQQTKIWIKYWDDQRNILSKEMTNLVVFYAHIYKGLENNYKLNNNNNSIPFPNFINIKTPLWVNTIMVSAIDSNTCRTLIDPYLSNLNSLRINWLGFNIGESKGSILERKYKIENLLNKQGEQAHLIKFIYKKETNSNKHKHLENEKQKNQINKIFNNEKLIYLKNNIPKKLCISQDLPFDEITKQYIDLAWTSLNAQLEIMDQKEKQMKLEQQQDKRKIEQYFDTIKKEDPNFKHDQHVEDEKQDEKQKQDDNKEANNLLKVQPIDSINSKVTKDINNLETTKASPKDISINYKNKNDNFIKQDNNSPIKHTIFLSKHEQEAAKLRYAKLYQAKIIDEKQLREAFESFDFDKQDLINILNKNNTNSKDKKMNKISTLNMNRVNNKSSQSNSSGFINQSNINKNINKVNNDKAKDNIKISNLCFKSDLNLPSGPFLSGLKKVDNLEANTILVTQNYLNQKFNRRVCLRCNHTLSNNDLNHSKLILPSFFNGWICACGGLTNASESN